MNEGYFMRKHRRIHYFYSSIHNSSRAFMIFTLLILTTSFAAAQNNQLNKEITLKVREKPLLDILEQLKSRYDLNIAYSKDMIDEKINASLQAKNMRLGTVLDRLLKGTGLTYKEMNNYIVIYKPQKKKTKKNVKTKIITVYDTLVRVSYDTLNKVHYDTVIKRKTRFDTVTCYDTVKVPAHNDLVWFTGAGAEFTAPFGSAQSAFGDDNRSSVKRTGTQYTGIPVSFGARYKQTLFTGGIGFAKEQYTLNYTIYDLNVDTTWNTQYNEGYWDVTVADRYYEINNGDTNWIEIKDSTWIAADTNRVLHTDSSYSHEKIQVSNAFKLIEIPLLIGYKIPIGENWDVYVQGGGIAGFLIRTKGKVYTGNALTNLSNLPVNTLQLTLTGKISIDYRIHKNWHLFGAATYRRKLTNYMKNINIPEQRNYFGGQVGIRYWFE